MKNYIVFIVFTCLIMTDWVLAGGKKTEKRSKKREEKKQDNIWEQDLSDQFRIDASTEGLKKVNLKCGADSMVVQLETEDMFDGVMYTKGSFYDQKEPCYVKPKKASRSLSMKFSFDECQTVKEAGGNLYKNVIVVQHDPDLVTPGDSAFELECDFRKSRSLEVSANLQARESVVDGSRITLISPDPSAANQIDDSNQSVFSESNTVDFIPNGIGNTQNIKHKGTVESVRIEL